MMEFLVGEDTVPLRFVCGAHTYVVSINFYIICMKYCREVSLFNGAHPGPGSQMLYRISRNYEATVRLRPMSSRNLGSGIRRIVAGIGKQVHWNGKV
jgi:hypothetical protein